MKDYSTYQNFQQLKLVKERLTLCVLVLSSSEKSRFAKTNNDFLMKRKIMLLIGSCIFTVVALAAIQSYFIYNTYKLTEKEVAQTIKKQVDDLEDNDRWVEINNAWMELTSQYITEYVQNKNLTNFEDFAEQKSDSISKIFTDYVRQNSKIDDYEIGYSVYVTSVTLTTETKNDSLYKGRLLILTNNDIKGDELYLASSRWENKLENEKVNFGLIVKSERFYSFQNWKSTIISKMAGLLIFSVILMAFVVILYYMSLKNLITQKRIADIKTDFVNNITHEFQTPLATMDIAIKTLKRKEEQMTPEHQAHTLSMIERQNDRLQKLFRQVTEASVAPIANKENIEISCSEIQEMIDDFKISKPGISIQCHQNQNFSIAMDRFHLNTILINLLDNAVKYGADEIKIELSKENNQFNLSVNDNGKGIPFKEQNTIFDKFYRVEKGNIHNTKGLGLGLFYIKQLVETYRGKIKVESEEEKGATFLITIPV